MRELEESLGCPMNHFPPEAWTCAFLCYCNYLEDFQGKHDRISQFNFGVFVF